MSTGPFTCPTCQMQLRLAQAPAAGSRIRCPGCAAVFSPVPAAPPKVERAAPVPSRAPNGQANRVQQAAAPRTAAAPDRRVQSGKPTAAKAPVKVGIPLPLILGLVAGVGLLLLLLVGGGGALAWWYFARDKATTTQQAAADERQEPRRSEKKVDPIVIPPVADPVGNPPVNPLANPPADPPANPPANPPRVDPMVQPPPPVVPPPVVAPTGDGSLPRELLERVKSATVYIRVVTADGKRGSGSGFFEKNSHKVVTNAHVVDMLVSDSKPPQLIEVVRNSGRPGEVTWKAAVVAVDRETDLALLRINAPPAEEAAIPGLDVSVAKNLTETQQVYILGFPLGDRVNSAVSVNKSSVSSLVMRPDGELKRVVVAGGMNPGNSGGPVIDSSGNVVGVAVAIIQGTQINFAIPGEHVHTFLNGRYTAASWSVEARQRDGKFYVPVTLTTIDPLNRISKLEVDYWVGDPNKKVEASDTQPILGPDAGPRRTLATVYAGQHGNVELELAELPKPGQVLWFQAVVTNGTGKTHWHAPSATYLLAPVEARPCVLTYKPPQGTSPTSIQSSANYKIAEDGREDSFRIRLEALFNETTAPEGMGTHATLGVRRFTTITSVNNEPAKTTDAFKTAVSRDVGKLVLHLIADKQGALISKRNDLTQVKDPASKDILDTLGEQLQQSLETGYIPLPGGEMRPEQTIQTQRQLPIELPKLKKSAAMTVTYRYRGIRMHNGKPMAVFAMNGTMDVKQGTTLTLFARMSGNAMVDPETGVVIRAHTDTQATIVLRSGTDKFQATGNLDTNITRGTEVGP